MTVCIASICVEPSGFIYIVAAADRMITSGDIEFEPDIDRALGNKIHTLTPTIFALTSGDTGLQPDLVQNTREILFKTAGAATNSWSVREAAEVYERCLKDTISNRLDKEVYGLFGLTAKTFVEKQSAMSRDHVEYILRMVAEYRIQSIQTAFAGIDTVNGAQTHPHIYVVDSQPGSQQFRCCDWESFAAVGGGARHAESQFMQVGFHRFTTLGESIFLTYLAKKRAETAPGVGKGTDIAIIGNWNPSITFLGTAAMGEIEKIYKKQVTGERKHWKQSAERAMKYVKGLTEPTKVAPTASTPPDGQSPASAPSSETPPSPLSTNDSPSCWPRWGPASIRSPAPRSPVPEVWPWC